MEEASSSRWKDSFSVVKVRIWMLATVNYHDEACVCEAMVRRVYQHEIKSRDGYEPYQHSLDTPEEQSVVKQLTSKLKAFVYVHEVASLVLHSRPSLSLSLSLHVYTT